MNKVIAEIDASCQTGRKLVGELEPKKCVKLESSSVDNVENSFTHEEVWNRLEKRFNDHYGTDYKFRINE